MNNKKKITAIIPTKNRSEYLTKFINNCEKSFRNLNYKIIIIDASNKEHHKKNKLLLKNKKIKIKNKNFIIILQKVNLLLLYSTWIIIKIIYLKIRHKHGKPLIN